MKKLIVLLMLFSFNILADEEDYNKVVDLCTHDMRNTPRLISSCVTLQVRAFNMIESYLNKNHVNIKKSDPVANILKEVFKKSLVVVNNKPLVNWVLFRIYFKRDMQTYLISQGKRDSDLDYDL